MKPSIILLSILLSQGVKAQTKYDTMPCIMLVSDTNVVYGIGEHYERVPYYPGQTFAQRGYEVFIQHDHEKEDPVYYGRAIYWVHFAYLDNKKRPIQYFVWMSKQLLK